MDFHKYLGITLKEFLNLGSYTRAVIRRAILKKSIEEEVSLLNISVLGSRGSKEQLDIRNSENKMILTNVGFK